MNRIKMAHMFIAFGNGFVYLLTQIMDRYAFEDEVNIIIFHMVCQRSYRIFIQNQETAHICIVSNDGSGHSGMLI